MTLAIPYSNWWYDKIYDIRLNNDDLAVIVWLGFNGTFKYILDLFALLTICCRRCICCSVFTVCGSLQSFASILFTLGLIAYAAGWGSKKVSQVCKRLNTRSTEPANLTVNGSYSSIMLPFYFRHIAARTLIPLFLGKSVNLGLLFG